MSESSKTSGLLIALAWLVVALPLGWGLYQSVVKSQPLFAGLHASATPAAPR